MVNVSESFNLNNNEKYLTKFQTKEICLNMWHKIKKI